jgi:hypothetical protein
MKSKQDVFEFKSAIRGIEGDSYSDYQNYPKIIEEEKHSEPKINVLKNSSKSTNAVWRLKNLYYKDYKTELKFHLEKMKAPDV